MYKRYINSIIIIIIVIIIIIIFNLHSLSHGHLRYQTFKSVEEILWSDHSNKTFLAALSDGAIY